MCVCMPVCQHRLQLTPSSKLPNVSGHSSHGRWRSQQYLAVVAGAKECNTKAFKCGLYLVTTPQGPAENFLNSTCKGYAPPSSVGLPLALRQ